MGFGAKLRAFLLDKDLAYQQVEHHSHCAVWEENRESEMVIATRVQILLLLIVTKGWSPDETILALAREIADGPSGELTRQKNLELAAKSCVWTTAGAEGYLIAPYREEILRIATGVGSHTTCVLRLIDYIRNGGRLPATEGLEHLAVDGYLSYERIIERQPTLKDPVDQGMRYTIIRKEIADLCPDVMRILSEADNSKHDNYQQESFMQTMYNLHRRATRSGAKTEEDYHKIVKQVSRGKKPSFVKAAECYAEYVRVLSGGAEKTLLIEIDEYIKTLKVFREVPPEFFRDLARLPGPHIALYIVGLVKATVSCPSNYNKSGSAKVFLPTDLTSIFGANKERVLQAHKIMVAARDFATRAGVDNGTVWVEIKGNLDVRLVMFTHDKTAPKRKKYNSINEIAVDFYNDLAEKFAEMVTQFECPWVAVQIANAPTAKAKAKPAMTIREINVSGVVTKEQMKNDHGVVVGAFLKKKNDDTVPPTQVVAIGDKVKLAGGLEL